MGLRIQRMAMDGNDEFNDPSNYHYLTVASPSCHDVQPTRAWCVCAYVCVCSVCVFPQHPSWLLSRAMMYSPHVHGVCVHTYVGVGVCLWVPVSVCVRNTRAGFSLVP